jgi:long-chain acyl-CoA synthetase
MTALVRFFALSWPRVVADAPSEFIISDLALASHSITSFTISSSTLLAPVLESHLPAAIITHAELLPQVLELIYDAGDKTGNHTIILVGEPSPQAMASVASRVKVLKFSEVEREGVRVEKTITPLPSESCSSPASIHNCDLVISRFF